MSGFRLDIQGLRAIAVVLVVLDHAFAWPTGGFMGVDVFYVISGYLISAHILREVETTGTLSFRDFYLRRVRRIFPVAFVVAVATVIVSFLLWFPPRAIQASLDALSAMLFVSNFHFMAIGTDYLQQQAAVSPFQHYWSLSIEEQFYTIWPLLLLGLASLMPSRKAMFLSVIALIVASLAWGLWNTLSAPTSAYFETGARAWELLAGALLAIYEAKQAGAERQTFVKMRRAVSITGASVIILSAIVVSPAWMIPVPTVGLSVIGAMAVVWANAPVGRLSLLGNALSQWLGKVSYSLYLWHFPVLVFSKQFGETWQIKLATLPIMLVLSWLSYLYVERAVLESRFLQAGGRRKWPFKVELSVSLSALVAITVFALAQLYGPGAVRSANPWLTRLTGFHQFESAPLASVEQREADIRIALAAKAWPPEISEQLATMSENQFAESMTTCRMSPMSEGPWKTCRVTYGNTSVFVVGDSVAASWVPMIDGVARAKGWDVTAITFSNCSLFDVDVSDASGSPAFTAACRQRRAELFALLREMKPEIVFLSASESALTYTGLPMPEAAKAWQEGAKRTFSKLSNVAQIVVLENPPWGESPLECAGRYSTPGHCIGTISQRHKLKSDSERAATDSFSNANYVSTRSWFCLDDRCPVFASGLVVRVDLAHLTRATSALLSPVLEQTMSR
ncbi:peptidoglycan/LPS O-acetylase OafA/YrhL [Rhodobacter aestuarii]|uniref:Peptidoglycan/LPS O-acetylase OafA/YrhL, contains acyltransferase and SGNH-hydrolase domains n=1 Tax=Rhodobacter aestuarii TaxID=453582 RepID=A0A1N7M9J5_9RHOB|nr:peptidoglycan/LPS O-acetylase OafA/YrhL [Rhodobacter aestuarii]SIS82785.1 Peptidoglycan/LPS O-acetylase OafA/YrhL, contains acyltransferase and SGNH-hydrolase domains [Rhodobacter aestuarii]